MLLNIVEEFIENLSVGILIQGQDFKIVACNQVACNIFSMEKEDILNKKFIEFIDISEEIKEEIKKFENEILSGISNIQDLSLEINNNNLYIQINRAYHKIDDKDVIICSIVDNTAQVAEKNKLYMEINTVIRYLDEILYSITHDFKKPISIVKTFTKMIMENITKNVEENAISQEIQQNLVIINTTTNLLERLVDDLFEYSTILNQDITYINVDLDAVFNNILEDFKDAIETYNISINIGYLPIIKSNELYMKKVISSLISNSIKFRDKDRPLNINIDSKLIGNFWEIIYSDNGIGFNPKYNNSIFGLFKKLSSHKKYSGTGIGLAMTKQIIEGHGGTISAEGNPGAGATFIIRIPKS
jgi:light-regulated signal transduction histidine kinase (bacteriophytochrome)